MITEKSLDHLTPQEIGAIGMIAYGFTYEEVDRLSPQLGINTAEDILEQDCIIPNSWTTLGFSQDRPPITPLDWERVYEISMPYEESGYLKEIAKDASAVWTQRTWRRRPELQEFAGYYERGLLTFEESIELPVRELDELKLLFPRSIRVAEP